MTECDRKRVHFQPTTKAGGICNRVQKKLFFKASLALRQYMILYLLNLFEHILNQHSPDN